MRHTGLQNSVRGLSKTRYKTVMEYVSCSGFRLFLLYIMSHKVCIKCAENLNDFIQVSLKMWWRISAVETKMHTVCLYPDVFMQMIFKWEQPVKISLHHKTGKHLGPELLTVQSINIKKPLDSWKKLRVTLWMKATQNVIVGSAVPHTFKVD